MSGYNIITCSSLLSHKSHLTRCLITIHFVCGPVAIMSRILLRILDQVSSNAMIVIVIMQFS